MSDNRTHLFISYAIEDVVLAKWLARKLAAAGYAVWFDQMKLLGGEPWPQTIDDAIKERTFRMLALMSANSISKPNPTKERTAALRIGRQTNTPDFLITLKVDDSELDWQTTDIPETLLLATPDAVIARCLPFAFAPQTPLRASFRQRAITAVGSDHFA